MSCIYHIRELRTSAKPISFCDAVRGISPSDRTHVIAVVLCWKIATAFLWSCGPVDFCIELRVSQVAQAEIKIRFTDKYIRKRGVNLFRLFEVISSYFDGSMTDNLEQPQISEISSK